MPVSEAFEHLLENIGVHFDRQCVEALINYYNSNFTDNMYSPKSDFATLNNI